MQLRAIQNITRQDKVAIKQFLSVRTSLALMADVMIKNGFVGLNMFTAWNIA